MRALSLAADRLMEGGRGRQAVRLAFSAAMRSPRNREAAKVLEKTLSCCGARGEAEKIYGKLLAGGGACQDHYYNLAMFRKRSGDNAGMRGAFLGLLGAPGAGATIHSYIALCSLDRYREAFEAADRLIISSPPGEPVLSRLWNPWGDRSTEAPAGFMGARLSALGRARLPAGLEQYRHFLRGALLLYASRTAEALAEFAKLPRLPAARYGWMRFPEGWAALRQADFRRARAAFEKSAASPVSAIQSLGRLAEVHICTGRPAAGFACLERALREAHFSQLPGLHTWKGQLLLFTGRYAEAERSLAEGGRRGDDAAWCWRGAALALAGRLEDGLLDLEKAVRLFPTDLEALTWRGEVLRLLGRQGPAITDLDRVLSRSPGYPWALINRALCRRALGDPAGMEADFALVEAAIRNFLEEAVPAGRGEPRRERVRRMLLEACRLAMGNRRDDKYFYQVWLKKNKTARRRRA